MTDWLLLDFGETISLPLADDAVSAMATLVERDTTDFLHRYWAERPAYDLGLPALDYWSRVLGRDARHIRNLAAELTCIDTEGSLHLDPHALPRLIAEANRLSAQVALLSNAPEALAAAIDHSPWATEFTHRVYSCRLGHAKPSAAAFMAALHVLGADDPRKVLFVDDRLDNIAGAAELGLSTHLWSRRGSRDPRDRARLR